MKFLQRIFRKKSGVEYEGDNAGLVHAMHEVSVQDNPVTRKRLYEAMLASTLIIPTPELPEQFREPGQKSAGANTQIDMIVFPDKDSRKVTPAFTDLKALRVWDPNTPYLSIKAQSFFEMVAGTDIQSVVINPFDPIRRMVRPGGFVNRAEFDLLAKGLAPSRIGPEGVQFQMKRGQPLLIGVPASPLRDDLKDGLRAAASKKPGIRELYLFQMATSVGPSLTMIGIEVDETVTTEQEGELALGLGASIKPILGEGRSLDFAILRGELRGKVKANGILIFSSEGG